MEKDCYEEIIEEVSKKLADKFCSEEEGIAARATMIDQDVQSLVQEIGREATKNILETTRDEVITKKIRRNDNSPSVLKHRRGDRNFYRRKNYGRDIKEELIAMLEKQRISYDAALIWK